MFFIKSNNLLLLVLLCLLSFQVKSQDKEDETHVTTGFLLNARIKNLDGTVKCKTFWFVYENSKLQMKKEFDFIISSQNRSFSFLTDTTVTESENCPGESCKHSVSRIAFDRYHNYFGDKKKTVLGLIINDLNRNKNCDFSTNDFEIIDYIGNGFFITKGDFLTSSCGRFPKATTNKHIVVPINPRVSNKLIDYYPRDEVEEIHKKLVKKAVDSLSVPKMNELSFFLSRNKGRVFVHAQTPVESSKDTNEVVSEIVGPASPRIMENNDFSIDYDSLKANYTFMKDAFLSPKKDIVFILEFFPDPDSGDEDEGGYRILGVHLKTGKRLVAYGLPPKVEIVGTSWSSGMYVNNWDHKLNRY